MKVRHFIRDGMYMNFLDLDIGMSLSDLYNDIFPVFLHHVGLQFRFRDKFHYNSPVKRSELSFWAAFFYFIIAPKGSATAKKAKV